MIALPQWRFACVSPTKLINWCVYSIGIYRYTNANYIWNIPRLDNHHLTVFSIYNLWRVLISRIDMINQQPITNLYCIVFCAYYSPLSCHLGPPAAHESRLHLAKFMLEIEKAGRFLNLDHLNLMGGCIIFRLGKYYWNIINDINPYTCNGIIYVLHPGIPKPYY